MARQLMLVFEGEYRGDKPLQKFGESKFITTPLILLALGSLGIVYSMNPFGHSNSFVDFLFQVRPEIDVHASGFIAIVSAGIALFGLAIGSWIWRPKKIKESSFSSQKSFLVELTNNAFYFDWFYLKVLQPTFDFIASTTSKIDTKLIDPFVDKTAVGFVMVSKVADLFDKLVVDGLVNLSAWISNLLGGFIRLFHTTRVQMHFVWALLGMLLIVIWLNLI
jgi:NADH-quinone oxidoreductase subunit L